MKYRYNCPELFTYKKEWIPYLEQVKLEISNGEATYVCYAIADLMVTGQPNRELRALHREIQLSLGGASTITMWSYWNPGYLRFHNCSSENTDQSSHWQDY